MNLALFLSLLVTLVLHNDVYYFSGTSISLDQVAIAHGSMHIYE